MSKFVFVLSALTLFACSHNSPRKPAANADEVDTAAVVAKMNAIMDGHNDWYYGIENAKIVNGSIVAPPGTNRDPDYNQKAHPPGFEDCREAGINQFLLDLAQADRPFTSFDADASHRVYLPHVSPPARNMNDPDRPNANHEGSVRTVLSGSGHTLSYLMDDTDGRQCKVLAMEGELPKAYDRRETEQRYLMLEIPKMSAEHKADLAKTYKMKKEKDDAKLAAKAVGRLFETACHIHVANTALQQSIAMFRNQYGSDPVTLINLPATFDLVSPGVLSVDGVNVIMVDKKGQHSLVTSVVFKLAQASKDECSDMQPPVISIVPDKKQD